MLHIAVKIARLVNGQINDGDSWLDITGYAMLVHQHIEQEQKAKEAKGANYRSAPSDDKAMIEEMYDEITAEMKEALDGDQHVVKILSNRSTGYKAFQYITCDTVELD